MAFDFGDFAGGVSDGVTTGLGWREKLQQLQELQRAQQVKSSLGNHMLNGQPPQPSLPAAVPTPAPPAPSPLVQGGGAQPPGMQPPPGPQGPPAPGMNIGGDLAALSQAQAGPQAPGPQAPAPLARPPMPQGQGAPPPGGPPMGQPAGGPAPPAMPPGGAPGGPPGGDQPSAPVQLPDPLTSTDPNSIADWGKAFKAWQDQSEQKQMTLAQQLNQEHVQRTGKPMDPITLYDAVETKTKEDESIGSAEKAMMLADLQTKKLQTQIALGQYRGDVSMRNTDVRSQTSERNADLRAHVQESIANLAHADRAERNDIYRQAVGWSHDDRQFAIESANARGDAANATKLQAVDEAVESGNWRALAGIMGREYTAEVGMGGSPDKPAIPKAPTLGRAPPRVAGRGAAVGAKGGGADLKAQAKAAIAAGAPRAEVIKRLQQQGVTDVSGL